MVEYSRYYLMPEDPLRRGYLSALIIQIRKKCRLCSYRKEEEYIHFC
jgi:hypothetical protein